jgi:hypothetical protein
MMQAFIQTDSDLSSAFDLLSASTKVIQLIPVSPEAATVCTELAGRLSEIGKTVVVVRPLKSGTDTSGSVCVLRV